MNNEVITFKDENGKDLKFEILGIEVYEDKAYCICYPIDDSGTEVYIYRVESSGNDEYDNYVFEENSSIRIKVFEQFKERNKEKYKFN